MSLIFPSRGCGKCTGGSGTMGNQRDGLCDVCGRSKRVTYCDFCKAWICGECWWRVDKRAWAAGRRFVNTFGRRGR